MSSRKVIGLAQNTLVVSLPSAWTKKFGVVKGDVLELAESGATVSFSTSKGVDVPDRIVVDVTGVTVEYVKSLVSVLHKIGYDQVEFLDADGALIGVVRGRVNQCIGWEIEEESQKRIVVSAVVADDSARLDALVRRTFFLTLLLADGVAKFATGASVSVDELTALESENNRVSSYVHRLLNQQSDGAKTSFWYLLVWLQESIADDLRDLLTMDREVLRSAESEVSVVAKHVRSLHHAVFSNDADLFVDLRARNREIHSMLMAKADTARFASVFVRLISVVSRVYDSLGSGVGAVFLESR